MKYKRKIDIGLMKRKKKVVVNMLYDPEK